MLGMWVSLKIYACTLKVPVCLAFISALTTQSQHTLLPVPVAVEPTCTIGKKIAL